MSPALSAAMPDGADSFGAPTLGAGRFSWILLTMGDRPDALAVAVRSIPRDGVASTEVIVVANGCPDLEVPDGARIVVSETNVGIPGGRNLGASVATGDVLVFLDDDASVASGDLAARVGRRFSDEPELAVVGFRIADPISGETSRRHVPRLGRADPDRAGDVTSFLGGACAIRAEAFEAVGGLPADFFYALEETDLAWRLVAAGWRVTYDPAVVVHHPRTEIDRHGGATRTTARNRVLLARRLLPAAVGVIYVFNWSILTVVRGRNMRTLREHWAGSREGMRMVIERRPIGWRAVWRLARLGRPPIV